MEVAFVTLILILVIGYAFYALMRDRLKSAGGSATVMLGATDHMLNEDKKRAAQEIVQQLSGEIRHISEEDDGDDASKKSKR